MSSLREKVAEAIRAGTISPETTKAIAAVFDWLEEEVQITGTSEIVDWLAAARKEAEK